MTQIRGRVWRAGKPQDDFEFSAISDCLIEHDTLVWADIYDPDHAALKDLAQELGLNSWAVEDAVAESERTKASIWHQHRGRLHHQHGDHRAAGGHPLPDVPATRLALTRPVFRRRCAVDLRI